MNVWNWFADILVIMRLFLNFCAFKRNGRRTWSWSIGLSVVSLICWIRSLIWSLGGVVSVTVSCIRCLFNLLSIKVCIVSCLIRRYYLSWLIFLVSTSLSSVEGLRSCDNGLTNRFSWITVAFRTPLTDVYLIGKGNWASRIVKLLWVSAIVLFRLIIVTTTGVYWRLTVAIPVTGWTAAWLE